MTLYEFSRLSEQVQYDLTFKKGTFLDIKVEENSRFLLYALAKFFIEIEYCNKQNKIVAKRTFKEGELLDKYTNFTSLE